MPLPPPFIVCAAIKFPFKGEDVLVCGPRHGDCINNAIHLGVYPEDDKGVVCGFVDQENEFYTREEAWVIADKMGEIRRPSGWELNFDFPRPANVGDVKLLFSENLY